MKKNLLLLALIFLSSFTYGNEPKIFNPCTSNNVTISDILNSKRHIYLNKIINYLDSSVIFFSYLNNDDSVCYEKRFDILFKVKNKYIYNEKLLNDVIESELDINSTKNGYIVSFEYGNGSVNSEDYFLIIKDDNIFIKERRFISYRYNDERVERFKKLNILDVEFSKLINN